MVSPKLTRRRNTRQQILQAAYALFLSQGYHGTSMRSIATQAGISLGAIYNHFESKEEIFTELLEAHHPAHQVLPTIQRVEGQDIESFVRHSTQRMLEALGQRPDFFNLMLIEVVEFNSVHIPALYEAIFPRVVEAIEGFAQGEAELREIPLPTLLRAFIGLMLSHYLTGKLLGGAFAPADQATELEHFVEIFLHGILKSEA